MSATPDFIDKNRGIVTVKVEGLTSPMTADWVGVYSPITTNFIHTSPVKLKMLLTEGVNNTVTFSLLNMRADYVFAFFRSGVSLALTPGFVGEYVGPSAVSNPVHLSETLKDTPHSIHLALGEHPSLMTVMWTTKYSASHGMLPLVQYWKSDDPGTLQSATAETATYAATDMCPYGPADSNGFIDPGQIHRAFMTGLEPHTNYTYRVSNAGNTLWSPENYTFTSAGADPTGAVRMIVLADMGTNEIKWDGATNGGHAVGDNAPTVNVTEALHREITTGWWHGGRPTAVLHHGDLGYAVGFAGEWEEWMAQIEPYASRAPLMVQVGNHERNWNGDNITSLTQLRTTPRDLFSWGSVNSSSSGGECGIPTETRFCMPTWPWGTKIPGKWGMVDRTMQAYNDQPWYSFTIGPVFIYMLSTEHDMSPGSAQYIHFESTLQSVNRTIYPWLLVTGHRMMYISSTDQSLPDGDQPIAGWMRTSLEPLFVKYSVDISFYGHHHSYQRTCPVINLTCVAPSQRRAPIHIVIGTAGTEFSTNIEEPNPPWIEYLNDQVYGYGRLFANTTDLLWEFRVVPGGEELDSLHLKR